MKHVTSIAATTLVLTAVAGATSRSNAAKPWDDPSYRKDLPATQAVSRPEPGKGGASNSVNWKQLAEQPKEKLSALDYNWINEEPDVMARAMVLADDRLFIAGPRDVVDEKKMWGRSNDKAFKDKMTEQAEWSAGKRGAIMQVYSKKDGKRLAEQKLDNMPAFDGLIAAGGRLYMVTENGSIVCYQGK